MTPADPAEAPQAADEGGVPADAKESEDAPAEEVTPAAPAEVPQPAEEGGKMYVGKS